MSGDELGPPTDETRVPVWDAGPIRETYRERMARWTDEARAEKQAIEDGRRDRFIERYMGPGPLFAKEALDKMTTRFPIEWPSPSRSSGKTLASVAWGHMQAAMDELAPLDFKVQTSGHLSYKSVIFLESIVNSPEFKAKVREAYREVARAQMHGISVGMLRLWEANEERALRIVDQAMSNMAVIPEWRRYITEGKYDERTW